MRLHQIVPVSLALALTACASAPPGAESIASRRRCVRLAYRLARSVIAPLTRWRIDQKEPDVREAIAAKAIAAVAPSISCAASARVLPIAAERRCLGQSCGSESSGRFDNHLHTHR